MIERILFVCIGNICRSPMAEALFKHRIANTNFNIQISSAGLAALVDREAAKHVQMLLETRHIDISPHRARQLTAEMVKEADLILTMEEMQKKEIERRFPFAHGKVFLLGKWGNFEIPDPYGGSPEYFEEILNLIDKGLDDWQKRICKN